MLPFTAEQRRRLATAGKMLTPDERRRCCDLVKPATILVWFRQLAARTYDSSDVRRGRPPKTNDVRKLVIKLATEAPRWGYTKIRDALRTGLGIEIGRTTWAADRERCQLDEREIGSWKGRQSVSLGRDAELLPPRGRMTAGDGLADTTGQRSRKSISQVIAGRMVPSLVMIPVLGRHVSPTM